MVISLHRTEAEVERHRQGMWKHTPWIGFSLPVDDRRKCRKIWGRFPNRTNRDEWGEGRTQGLPPLCPFQPEGMEPFLFIYFSPFSVAWSSDFPWGSVICWFQGMSSSLLDDHQYPHYRTFHRKSKLSQFMIWMVQNHLQITVSKSPLIQEENADNIKVNEFGFIKHKNNILLLVDMYLTYNVCLNM